MWKAPTVCRGLRSFTGCAGQPAAVRGHCVDCTTPFGHVVFDQMTPVRVEPVRLAPVRLVLVRLKPVMFKKDRLAPVRSTPGPIR